MTSHILSTSTSLFNLLTRQSAAELEVESKNEETFFNKYKFLIIGGLFGFVIQVLAICWFFNRRRQRKVKKAADEENSALAKAQTFGSVGVQNAWGGNINNGNMTGTTNMNASVWGVGGGNTVNGLGVQDVPPAYDGRRGEVERFGPGGKI